MGKIQTNHTRLAGEFWWLVGWLFGLVRLWNPGSFRHICSKQQTVSKNCVCQLEKQTPPNILSYKIQETGTARESSKYSRQRLIEKNKHKTFTKHVIV